MPEPEANRVKLMVFILFLIIYHVYIADNQRIVQIVNKIFIKKFELTNDFCFFAPAKLINFINFKLLIMSDITSRVKSIIVNKLGIDESEVVPEASFTADLGADSLDTVELIMEFEKEFGISISDQDAEKIATVGDAISYMEANVK